MGVGAGAAAEVAEVVEAGDLVEGRLEVVVGGDQGPALRSTVKENQSKIYSCRLNDNMILKIKFYVPMTFIRCIPCGAMLFPIQPCLTQYKRFK